MHPGMIIRAFNGRDGKIHIPGLGAVIGTFSEWHLRREEDRPNGDWSLHAVLSSQTDLLKNVELRKSMRITCTLNKDQSFELCEFGEVQLEGASLLIKGVVQCPK